jgi:hypothetical protein
MLEQMERRGNLLTGEALAVKEANLANQGYF